MKRMPQRSEPMPQIKDHKARFEVFSCVGNVPGGKAMALGAVGRPEAGVPAKGV